MLKKFHQMDQITDYRKKIIQPETVVVLYDKIFQNFVLTYKFNIRICAFLTF